MTEPKYVKWNAKEETRPAKKRGEFGEIKATGGNLAFGGDFVCSVSECSTPEIVGIKAFVPYVLPSEEFTAQIYEHEKRFLKADAPKIITASPERITPNCVHFGSCGGCSLQHSNYEYQLKLKQDMIESTLKLQTNWGENRPETIEISTIPTQAFAYRDRIKLQVNHLGEVGFFKRNSNHIVIVDNCPISNELINKAINQIKRLNKRLISKFSNILVETYQGNLYLQFLWRGLDKPQRDGLVTLTDLFLGFIELAEISVLAGTKEVASFSGESSKRSKYPIGHFSQVNPIGNEALQKIVLQESVGYATAVELYAGAGNFSIPLAQSGLKMTAVEQDSALVSYGQNLSDEKNLKINWITNSCEKFIEHNQLSKLVIADPPRSGLKPILEAFAAPQVQKLIYISCSLPHLTRDLTTLLELNYRLTRTYFVDMFPQTHYVETVAVLERIS